MTTGVPPIKPGGSSYETSHAIALVFEHGRLLDRIEVWIVRREITFRDLRSCKLRRLHRHVLRKCMREATITTPAKAPANTILLQCVSRDYLA
jgi:hypothetical protein